MDSSTYKSQSHLSLASLKEVDMVKARGTCVVYDYGNLLTINVAISLFEMMHYTSIPTWSNYNGNYPFSYINH